MNIDKGTYDEIKSALDLGDSPETVAKDFGYGVDAIKLAGLSKSYAQFTQHMKNRGDGNNKGLTETKKIPLNSSKGLENRLAPVREEETKLKEKRDYLVDHVRVLTKAVEFLTHEKQTLEQGIRDVKKNIALGIELTKILEEM